MKAMMRRSFRSAAMVAIALIVGLAAVPLFAGADAVDSAKATGGEEASQCPLAAKAKATSSCAVSGAADKFIAALLGDAEAGAKVAAALAKEHQTCGATAAKADDASLNAKVGAVVASKPSACSAANENVAAKTEAVDAKIAKVTADAPGCCMDKAAEAKVAKVVEKTEVPACCQDKTAESEEAGD